MAYEFEQPELGKIIRDPTVHMRLVVTEASRLYRHHDFSKAFEATNEAMTIFREEVTLSEKSKIARETAQLLHEWHRAYSGPSSETFWVGPPGASEPSRYWASKRMWLHRIGSVWMDVDAKNAALMTAGAPPVRLVAGLVAWLDLEQITTNIAGVPICHFAGVNGRMLECFDLIEQEGGELSSRALSCNGNCLLCSKSKLTDTYLRVDRLPISEWKRIGNRTRRTLIPLAHRFTYLISKLYGAGVTMEPEIEPEAMLEEGGLGSAVSYREEEPRPRRQRRESETGEPEPAQSEEGEAGGEGRWQF